MSGDRCDSYENTCSASIHLVDRKRHPGGILLHTDPVVPLAWWRWALVSPDGVASSRMVSVSASVNLPFHHKVQKFSSGTGSPGWSWKKGCKTVVVVLSFHLRVDPLCFVPGCVLCLSVWCMVVLWVLQCADLGQLIEQNKHAMTTGYDSSSKVWTGVEIVAQLELVGLTAALITELRVQSFK